MKALLCGAKKPRLIHEAPPKIRTEPLATCWNPKEGKVISWMGSRREESCCYEILLPGGVSRRILKVTKKSGNRGRCRKLSLWKCRFSSLSLSFGRHRTWFTRLLNSYSLGIISSGSARRIAFPAAAEKGLWKKIAAARRRKYSRVFTILYLAGKKFSPWPA